MENTQSISAFSSKVKPFRAFVDDADFVIVTPGAFGPPPTFNVSFGKYVPGVDAKPAVPNTGALDLPDTPAVAAVPASVAVQRTDKTLTLTQSEWDNWNKNQSDNSYIMSIVASRFGLTLTA